MDPSNLSPDDWRQLISAVNRLWLFAALVATGALSFLVAQGTIPSLLRTRQMPAGAAVMRPALYVVSAIAIVVAVVTVVNALSLVHSLLNVIYPRWWI